MNNASFCGLLLLFCCKTILICEASEELIKNSDMDIELDNLLTQSAVEKSGNGDGSIAHPYDGPCNPSPNEIGINITFPAHLEYSSRSGEATISKIKKFLQMVDTLLPITVAILEKTVPINGILSEVGLQIFPITNFVLSHLTDVQQQEKAIREYEVDSAITKSAFVTLRSKFGGIFMLLEMVNNISGTVTQHDIKRAMPVASESCREILELFEDPESAFFKHPLLSTPYLLSFAGLQYSVALLSVAVEKHLYLKFAYDSLIRVNNLIQIFKYGAIRDRSIRVGGSWPPTCEVFYISGSIATLLHLLTRKSRGRLGTKKWTIFYPSSCYTPIITDQVPGTAARQFVFANDFKMDVAKQCYTKAVEQKYESFFDNISQQFHFAVKSFQKFSPKINRTRSVDIPEAPEDQHRTLKIVILALFIPGAVLITIYIKMYCKPI